MLITAGIVLSSHHAAPQQAWALSVGAMIAAVAGNQVGYVIGHRHGSRMIARKDGKYLNIKNLHKVNVLLERHGFWAVMISRWIPWIRTLCPLVSGAAKMNHRKFTVASTIGAVVWAPVLLLVGFYVGNVLDMVPWLMPVVLGIMVAVLVVGTVLGLRHYQQEMARPTEYLSVEDIP